MLNGKQYLLTESPVRKGRLTEAWEQTMLPCGWTLFWERQLPLKHSKDWSFVLLGTAWQVDPGREADIQKLLDEAAMSVHAAARKTEGAALDETALNDDESIIIDMISSWCGRFLLIADSKVYMDCAGLLGVFYAEGALSCSTPVLCDYLGISVKKPNIVHGISPDFVPGERTQYPQIRRLLPDQIFDLSVKSPMRRSLLPGGVIACDSTKERDELFVRCLTQSLRNLHAAMEDRPIRIGLTGGVDSRTLLALMEKSGLDYTCFTLEHDEISKGDRKIPAKICKVLGREYRYIPRRGGEVSKVREFDAHCGGMSVDQDRLFYARGQYQALVEEEPAGNASSDQALIEKKPVVILRSGLWEICFSKFAQTFSEDARRHMSREDVEKHYKWLAYDKPKLDAICDWLDRIHEAEPDPDEACIMDADRFYWVLRCGCWLSDVEQSLTILDDTDCFQVLNSTLFFRILFGYSTSEESDLPDKPQESQSQDGKFQESQPQDGKPQENQPQEHKSVEHRLTELACPALVKIPYESDLPAHVQSKREKTARWHMVNRKLIVLYGPRPVLSRYKARVRSAAKKKFQN